MVVLDTPQGIIIYIYIYIASTLVQYHSGRIINYQINLYEFDPRSYVKAIDDMNMDYWIKVM